MKNKKTVTVTTSMFKLDIYWNGPYISAQLAILIGLLATRLFANNEAVIRMCTIFLLIDLVVLLYLLLHGASIETSGTSGNEETPKETMDVKVSHEAKPKEEKPKSRSKKSEIHNKVPVPNPSPTAVQKPVPEVKPELSVEEKISQSPNIKSLGDMTEEDWEAVFNMGGDE